MPPYERVTTGMWLDISKETLKWMIGQEIGVAAAIHSAEHAIMNRFPLSIDLRTECKAKEKENMANPTTRTRPARWAPHFCTRHSF